MQIAIQTMGGYDDTLALATWCETNGVASLAVADHYLGGRGLDSPALDQLVLLGGIARETSSLELCTLVSPLTFRHPAHHLKAAVTLDQMSDGRFTLGIGTGWMPDEHEAFGLELYPMKERFDRLAETLAYLRAALDGNGAGFSGEYYRLQGFDPQPRPQRLRIIVGGGGSQRTPDLAGRFADEFNVIPTEGTWSDRIERAHHARLSAGPRDGPLFISTAFPPLAGGDDDEYRTNLEIRARHSSREPGELADRYQALGIPHGSSGKLREMLAALADTGVERAYLQVGDDIERAIRQTELFMEAAAG